MGFNPGGQLSPQLLLARSSQRVGERTGKVKVRKLLAEIKAVLQVKQKPHISKAKQTREFLHPPHGRQVLSHPQGNRAPARDGDL